MYLLKTFSTRLKFAGSWQNWSLGDFVTPEKNREGCYGAFLKKSGPIFSVFCTIHASRNEKNSWNQTNNISYPWLPVLKSPPKYRNFHGFLKEHLPTPRRAKLSKYFKISFIRTTNISEEWREDSNLSHDQFLLLLTIKPDEPHKMTKSPTLTKSPPFTVIVKIEHF